MRHKQVPLASLLLLASSLAVAGSVAVPALRIIIHNALFSDPRGNSDVVGGNAYDRATDQLGVIIGGTNDAISTINPAKATAFVKYRSDKPVVATVSAAPNSSSTQRIVVSGVSRGKALISSPSLPSKKLGAFVFAPFQKTVVFHIITDSAGHSPGLSVAAVKAIIQRANSIWGSQANITFGTNPPIDEVTVPIDFGSAVDITAAASPDEQAIITAAKNTHAAVNVYFVHALFAPPPGPGAVPGVTRMPEADVFVSAASLDINRTTAHELGHPLGLNLASGTADYDTDPPGAISRVYHLMWGREGGGFTVTPTQGDIINPAR